MIKITTQLQLKEIENLPKITQYLLNAIAPSTLLTLNGDVRFREAIKKRSDPNNIVKVIEQVLMKTDDEGDQDAEWRQKKKLRDLFEGLKQGNHQSDAEYKDEFINKLKSATENQVWGTVTSKTITYIDPMPTEANLPRNVPTLEAAIARREQRAIRTEDVLSSVTPSDTAKARQFVEGLNSRHKRFKAVTEDRRIERKTYPYEDVNDVLKALREFNERNEGPTLDARQLQKWAATYALRQEEKSKDKDPKGSKKGERGGKKSEKNKDKKEEKDLSHIECYACHEMGHYANKCPNVSDGVESVNDGRHGKKQARATRELESDSDDDGEERLMLKSIREVEKMIKMSGISDGKKVSRMTRKVKVTSDDENLIGLDSMSNVDVYTNRMFVRDIVDVKGKAIKVDTLGGLYTLRQKARSVFTGKIVYFDAGNGINIMSTAQFVGCRTISEEGYDEVTLSDGTRLHFPWKHGLAVCDTRKDIEWKSSKSTRKVEAETVVGRPLTRREAIKANEARDLVKIMPGNRKALEYALRDGKVAGAKISYRDVQNDLTLNGKLTGETRGLTKQKKLVKYDEGFKYEDLLRDNQVALFGDLGFWNKVTVLFLIDTPYGFKQVIRVMKKDMKGIEGAIRKGRATYLQYGKTPTRLYFDSESSVVGLETVIQEMGIHVETLATGSHVSLAEIGIQHLWNQFRAMQSTLKYEALPSKAVELGLKMTALIANILGSGSGMAGISSYEALTGRKGDLNRIALAPFGSICEVTATGVKDSTRSKTFRAMFCSPADTQDAAGRFINLSTGRVVSSARFRVVNTEDEDIARVNLIAKKDGVDIVPIEEDDGEFDDPTSDSEEDFEDEIQDAVAADQELHDMAENDRIRERELQGVARLVDDFAAEAETEPNVPLGELERENFEVIENFNGETENSGVDLDNGPEPAEHGRGPDAAELVGDIEKLLDKQMYKIFLGGSRERNKVNCHMKLKQAMAKHGIEGTKQALKEVKQINDFRTWEGVKVKELTKGQRKRIIRSSMFFKEKFFANGEFDKLKARLVAGGHMQDKTLYDDLSSPTVNLPSIFILATLAARNGEHVMTVDVTGAYLNATMESEVHMRLEPLLASMLVKCDAKYKEFVNEDGSIVVKLKKALYGLVESAKLWYNHLKTTLEGIGYSSLDTDDCVFVNKNGTKIGLHVDDLLVTSSNKESLTELSNELKRVYKNITVHEGPILSYLGMEFDFSVPGQVTITQAGFVKEIVAFYNVQGKSILPHDSDLFNIDGTSKLLDANGQKELRSATAKILYLSKRTYPDLLPLTSHLTTRAEKYTEQDEEKMRKGLRYLSKFPNNGITLKAEGDSIEVHAYVDASHGIHADGKSHTGCVITLGQGGVYTKSHKQKIVSKSSTEAELIALSDSLSMILWTQQFLRDLGVEVGPVTVHEDNTSTISLAKKGKSTTDMTKHIKVRHYLIKQHIDNGDVELVHEGTDSMWADLLTKALMGSPFWRHLSKVTGQSRGRATRV